MVALGLDAWITLAVLVAVFSALLVTSLPADVIMLGGVTILLLSGVIGPKEALSGMANEGMVTVGVLFVVVAGLQQTGCMTLVAARLFGQPKGERDAQIRLMLPVAALSAFMNNTPLVAMMLPVVDDWSRKARMSASKLMIPLSYASILGGTCTLIGTSTNLVVDGLLIKSGRPGMSMFELAWVGLPCAVVGVAYCILFGRWLLPDRRPVVSVQDDARRYTVEMLVEPGSPLVGKSIEEAGLRHLPGMFLIEIDRDGDVLPAVGPEERLHANDRLVFAGVVESVVDLQKIRGLTPATNQVFKLDAPRERRVMTEAVVSDTCPLIGKTVREGEFRSVYNAVIIAVARNGELLRQRIGDIVLRAGDTLLLEAPPSFAKDRRNSRDFFLVSRVAGNVVPRHRKAWVAVLILAGMVGLATAGILPMVSAAMLAAGLVVLTRCLDWGAAKRAIDLRVLLVIGATLAIGTALEVSGGAATIAGGLIAFGGTDPWVLLVVVYGVTMLFTELITNNAAAALVFPIAMATADTLGVSFRPFAIAITMAASASFSTPIGYQTNLMVLGPGGYRFTDYFRVGIPLNLLMWLLASLIIPRVWPF